MNEDRLVEMRLAHLHMVQGVIVRIAGFSASAKNFCVTVLAALIAVGFQKPVPVLYLAALGVIIIFAIMDGYYLALERRFRDLFEIVAARDIGIATISLKPKPVNLGAFLNAMKSASICIIYVLLLLTTVPLLFVAGRLEAPRETCTCPAGRR